MNEQRQNILIGIFVVAILITVVAVVLFLKPSVGDGNQSIAVRFSDISGINEGTIVTFSGHPVGEVSKIMEIGNTRSEKADILGRVYFYRLILAVDTSVEVYTSDEIKIETAGLLGEKTIAIIPKAVAAGVKLHRVVPNEDIYADSVEPLQYAVTKISEVAEKTVKLLDIVTLFFNGNETTFLSILEGVNSGVGSAKNILKDVDELHVVASINHLVANIDRLLNMAENSNIKDGSLGKILFSDEFYLQLRAIMTKVNTFMNDLNQYGVLFQYNNQWKRRRSKLVAKLDKVSTPAQFESFFSNEIDRIQTSLTRLFVLSKRNISSAEKECFKKEFRILLQEVDALSDLLELYNDSLVNE